MPYGSNLLIASGGHGTAHYSSFDNQLGVFSGYTVPAGFFTDLSFTGGIRVNDGFNILPGPRLQPVNEGVYLIDFNMVGEFAPGTSFTDRYFTIDVIAAETPQPRMGPDPLGVVQFSRPLRLTTAQSFSIRAHNDEAASWDISIWQLQVNVIQIGD